MNENHSLQVWDQEKHANEKKSLQSLSPRIKFWGSIGISLLLTFVLLFIGIKRMRASYETARQNIYSDFYQTAYDHAEQQNHVSNYALISIEAAQEVSRLEVLAVSDSEFVIKDSDKSDPTISWLEVQGIGVFTVDLTACEFIADSERQYVLVRVPKPALTECKVSGTGKQFWKRSVLSVVDGRVVFGGNGSVDGGVRLAQTQLNEGRVKLEDSMKQNRGFYESAKTATVDMIGSLVRKWNPDIPNLQVDVEFFENN